MEESLKSGKLIAIGKPFKTLSERKDRIEYVTLVVCECGCGNVTVTQLWKIIKNGIKSCGCAKYSRDRTRSIKHGLSRSPEYIAFYDAKDRCINENNPFWNKYGGRGIEFRYTSIEEFIEDVGRRPDDKRLLDRIDVNGHYEKGNCRWVNDSESQRNRTDSIYLTAFGETKHICDWLEDPRCKVDCYKTLEYRHKTWNNDEKAITEPSSRKIGKNDKTILEAFGESKSISEWSLDDRCKVTAEDIVRRLRENWDIEEAIGTPLIRTGCGRDDMEQAFGEIKTVQEWLEDSRCKVTENALLQRRKKGWNFEEALTKPVRGDKDQHKEWYDQLVKLLNDGVPQQEAVKAIGISEQTALRLKWKFEGKKDREKIKNERFKIIHENLKNGKSRRQISEICGVSVAAIDLNIKEMRNAGYDV